MQIPDVTWARFKLVTLGCYSRYTIHSTSGTLLFLVYSKSATRVITNGQETLVGLRFISNWIVRI